MRTRHGFLYSEEKVAERTGLEPAASGVTGRRYNQLNYRSVARSCLVPLDLLGVNAQMRRGSLFFEFFTVPGISLVYFQLDKTCSWNLLFELCLYPVNLVTEFINNHARMII